MVIWKGALVGMVGKKMFGTVEQVRAISIIVKFAGALVMFT